MSKKKYKKSNRQTIGKSTEELTGTKIKYGSATYSLLCFAAMKSHMKEQSFSIPDVIYVLAGKLKTPSDTQRAINVLVGAGCLEESSNGLWRLTKFGLETRKIFAWYGSTVSSIEIEKNKHRAASRKKEISWEDEIDINLNL